MIPFIAEAAAQAGEAAPVSVEQIVYIVATVIVVVLSRFLAKYLNTKEKTESRRELLVLLDQLADMALADVEGKSSDPAEKRELAISVMVELLNETLHAGERKQLSVDSTSKLIGAALDKKKLEKESNQATS